MKRTADNAQKRPLEIFGHRDYAELRDVDWPEQAQSYCRFPRFGKTKGQDRIASGQRPSMGRGGSRIFSTRTYIQIYTWCIFRVRQFWKTDRQSDQKVSGVQLRSLSSKVVTFLQQVGLTYHFALKRNSK